MSIVSTNISYNSDILRQNLSLLLRTYPFLNVQTVGNSVIGKPIYVIKLGRGPKKVFYSASIHANELICTPILMKFVEDYCISYVRSSNLYGYSIRNLFNSTSIYIMPMVNPDGVGLIFIGIVEIFFMLVLIIVLFLLFHLYIHSYNSIY